MSDQHRDPSKEPDESVTALERVFQELNERMRAQGVKVEVVKPGSGASKTLIATFIPAPRIAGKTEALAEPKAQDEGGEGADNAPGMPSADGPGGADAGAGQRPGQSGE